MSEGERIFPEVIYMGVDEAKRYTPEPDETDSEEILGLYKLVKKVKVVVKTEIVDV